MKLAGEAGCKRKRDGEHRDGSRGFAALAVLAAFSLLAALGLVAGVSLINEDVAHHAAAPRAVAAAAAASVPSSPVTSSTIATSTADGAGEGSTDGDAAGSDGSNGGGARVPNTGGSVAANGGSAGASAGSVGAAGGAAGAGGGSVAASGSGLTSGLVVSGSGGVSSAALAALVARVGVLEGEVSPLASAAPAQVATTFTGAAAVTPATFQSVALSQKIDQLENVTITTPSIEQPSITGGTLSSVTLNSPTVSGGTFSNITLLGTTTVSTSTTASLTVSGAGSLGSLSVSGASVLGALSASGTTTLATSTLAALTVSGTTTLSGLVANGSASLGSLAVSGSATLASTTFSGMTSGAVPYIGAGGVLSERPSALFFDAANGRLGVGTASPTAPLTVVGATDKTFTVLTSSAQWAVYSDIFTARAQFRGERYRGTSASPLSVQKNDYILSIAGRAYDGTAVEQPVGIDFLVDGTPSNGSVPGRISFSTGSNAASRQERLTIKSDGNVGIGTTTPVHPLEIISSAGNTGFNLARSGQGGGLYLTSNGTGQAYFSGGSELVSTNWTARTTAAASVGISQGTLSFYTDGSLTAGNTFTPSARMTIDSSGNIGIGTTSPWGKLSVTNTGSGPSLVVEDQASPDATPFVVDQNGNVGVGTGSPSTRLEIRDSNAFSGHAIGNSTIGATSNVGIITNSPEGTDVGGMLTLGGMRDFAATNPGVFGGIRGAKENALNGNNDGYLGFYTLKGGEAFAERMRITSSGKVGIGTTSPWRTLSVAGTAAFSGLTSSTGGESAVCLSSSGELRVNTGAQTWGAPQSVGGSVAGGVEAG